MRILDWLFRRPGTRKTYEYATVIKFVYVYRDKSWRCVVPDMVHERITRDHLISLALRELHNCPPRHKDAAPYGHVWPGGSNIRYMVEFVFVGKVYPDGFTGWEVTYTHPNENCHISNGGRFKYGRAYEDAIIAFMRHELAVAEEAILVKLLSQE